MVEDLQKLLEIQVDEHCGPGFVRPLPARDLPAEMAPVSAGRARASIEATEGTRACRGQQALPAELGSKFKQATSSVSREGVFSGHEHGALHQQAGAKSSFQPWACIAARVSTDWTEDSKRRRVVLHVEGVFAVTCENKDIFGAYLEICFRHYGPESLNNLIKPSTFSFYSGPKSSDYDLARSTLGLCNWVMFADMKLCIPNLLASGPCF